LVYAAFGKGGKRIKKTALAFSIQDIKSKGGLPRARNTGDNGQLVPRYFNRNVLQVVLPGAGDFNSRSDQIDQPPESELDTLSFDYSITDTELYTLLYPTSQMPMFHGI
jgi:hypothetical protein